jgi:hypothetical protein
LRRCAVVSLRHCFPVVAITDRLSENPHTDFTDHTDLVPEQ